jgi:hypothetical protein
MRYRGMCTTSTDIPKGLVHEIRFPKSWRTSAMPQSISPPGPQHPILKSQHRSGRDYEEQQPSNCLEMDLSPSQGSPYRTKLRRQRTYKHNSEARSRNHCCRGKAINTTYSECVSVALLIQHAMRMCHTILSSVACPALPYYSRLSHKRYNFRKTKLWNKEREFWFHLQLWNISHPKKNSARYYHKST